MLWIKSNHLSIDERYDSGNAQCEALVDTSIETKGIASERAGMSRNTDQPADEERTIRGYRMFWTCVSCIWSPSTMEEIYYFHNTSIPS